MKPQLFADLNVSKELAKALDRLGLEEASPVQVAVVAAVTGKRSAVIAAPPASGRKLSLAMAAVEGCDSKSRALQVILLTSNRERALQLAAGIRDLAVGRKNLGCAVIVAGQSADRVSAVLKDKPAVLIGTPGRIREVLEAEAISREEVGTVLLDGADELLEVGYADDLRALLSSGNEAQQVLALATFISPDVEGLAGEHCPDADRVVVPTVGAPPALTWYDVEPGGRLTALSLLTDRHVVQRGLVFANSPRTAADLAGQLTAAGYPAEAVLADLSAAARERVLKKFRGGDLTFLVSTDAAMHGIEVEPADVVVHYEWPLDDGALAVRQAGLRPGGQGFALVSGRQLVRARALSRRGSPARIGRLPVLSEVPEARLQAGVARLRDALSVRNPAACRTMVDILIADGFDPAVIAGAAIRLLGAPTPPPQAIPAPLPVPVPVTCSAPVPPMESSSPAPEYLSPSEGMTGGSGPVDEAVDWSPGVSTGSGSSYSEGSGPETAEGGESSGEDSGAYSGGVYTADGYVITDDVSEDGVVYPPGANFGDDSPPDHGFGNGGGGSGDRRRGPRRERGGRGRGREGGGGGGGGGGVTAPGMKRLWLNVGRMDRIQPKDIVGCILGETGIPPVSIGRVQLFERHSLVDVSASFEPQIIDALNRAVVRGRKLKAKLAAY